MFLSEKLFITNAYPEFKHYLLRLHVPLGQYIYSNDETTLTPVPQGRNIYVK